MLPPDEEIMKVLPPAVLIASLFFMQSAFAEDLPYPKKAYDATYEIKASTGDSTMRMGSNGKGLMFVQSMGKSKTMDTTSITDYPNKVVITVIPASKMIMRTPMTTTQPVITDVQSAQKQGAKSLGAKTVDGHPCHGFESSTKGIISQVWIGDDIQHMVHSDTTGPNFKSSMSLKTWSDKAPSADAFKTPAGYKEMSTGK
jgi:hypothetical protein